MGHRHPNSLANLEGGGRAKKRGGLDRKRKMIFITEATDKILKKSGNASMFVELLVEAHQRGRLLTPQEILEGELSDQDDGSQG